MKTVHTRTFLLLTLMTLPLLSHDSAAAPLPPLPTDPRAQEYVTRLHLELLAGESGYFGDVNVSTLEVTSDGRGFKVHSSIFYLLTKETPINYLHHLASDDVHILVDGGPVDYFIFHPDGTVELQTLGRDLKAGERLMVSIPGGCWKALRLRPEAPFVGYMPAKQDGPRKFYKPRTSRLCAREHEGSRRRQRRPLAAATTYGLTIAAFGSV